MKILILSIYPAPYRIGLFEYFAKENNCDIFFEHSDGDERDHRWFQQGNYYSLDDFNAKIYYKQCIRNIKKYDFVLLYDFCTLR